MRRATRTPLEVESVVVENGDMVTLNTLRREKKTEILQLGEKYGTRNIRVFGSVARGDSRVTSVLIGASRVEQLAENFAAALAGIDHLLPAGVEPPRRVPVGEGAERDRP